MKKTKIVKFRVMNCCGDFLKEVTMRIPINVDSCFYYAKAIAKAGFRQHICDGCYDQAYHVREVK